jgi:hypothetical protein
MSVGHGARRWRVLGERECYLRLYGHRSGLITLVDEAPTSAALRPTALQEGAALHLVFPIGRSRARMSGEEIRVDLLRRMHARTEADRARAA